MHFFIYLSFFTVNFFCKLKVPNLHKIHQFLFFLRKNYFLVMSLKNITKIKPVFQGGVIADVQYADVDNRYNFTQTKLRKYRTAEEKLEQAVEKISKIEPDFFLQLGDLVDVNCKKDLTKLERLLQHFNKLDRNCKILHCSGNHEFYNFDRTTLKKHLYHDCDLFEDTFGFKVEISDKLALLHLDSYDISVTGRETGSHKHSIATNILKDKNPNEPIGASNSKTNLIGNDQRFVAYTGGCSQEQIVWLSSELSKSDEKNQLVIIASHCNVHPDAIDSAKTNTIWNYEDILPVLQKHRCVTAFFAGHNHDGGYCCDNAGIHHITMEGIIEHCDNNAFGILKLYGDEMVLEGFGDTQTRKLPYRKGVFLDRKWEDN